MQNLDMQTPDITSMNVEKIWQLFPNVITEKEENGKIIKAIDFDLLKQALSKELVEDNEERYTLNWPWKKASLLKANTPIEKTLRPCREDSVNFDTTENLYIEWDNFEVLKILQESYLWKVKMIYIDPPYNTGKDFVYKDNFTKSKADADEEAGVEDEDGWKLFKNTDINGRFHSDWLSMMYERITVARDLLSEDWVIFMSIDDNEAHNLRKITDEIFWEENFVADIVWNSTKSVTNTALISNSITHNLVYFKSIDYFTSNREKFRLSDNGEWFSNPDHDSRWPWKADPFQVWWWRPNQQYEIKNPNTWEIYTPNPNCSWKNDFNNFKELLKDDRIVFWKTWESWPQRKRFKTEALERWKVAKTLWDDIETTTNWTQLLKKLFDNKSLFDNPKPVWLLLRMLELWSEKDSVVLDFFSWSATTAHAVIKLNAEDWGDRKFICVQLKEETDEKSEAFKAWYKNICEIWKERIRRAWKKIIEENKEELEKRETPLDTWFRVYKTDSSNMKDVFYHPSELEQWNLLDVISNIKEDRSSEDLLTQVILDLGLTLDMAIEKKEILWNTVYFVAWNSLVACFDENIDFWIVDEIAKEEPLRVVFRDNCFKTDSDRINFENRFKKLSWESDIRVI